MCAVRKLGLRVEQMLRVNIIQTAITSPTKNIWRNH